MTGATQTVEAAGRGDLARQVVAFNYRPLSYLHPDRLSGLLPAALEEYTRRNLLACPRTKRQLSRRVLGSLGAPPCGLDLFHSAERRMVLRGPAYLRRVTLLAGAVRHGGFLRTVVTGTALRQVIEALGAEAHAFALAHLPLSGRTAAAIPLDALRRSVERDGLACLKSWSAAQPGSLRARLALMYAPDDWHDGAPPAALEKTGAALVAAVAGELAGDD